MKKVLFAAFLLVSSNAIFAQINQGNWMVGGNVNFTHSKIGDAKSNHFNISPDAGYFFIDQLAAGLRLNYGSDKVKGADDASTDWTVSPFVRYYFLPSGQMVNIFVDGSYGFGKTGDKDKVSYNQFEFMAGPAVFLSPNVALEFALFYRSKGGDAYKTLTSDDRLNQFGVNIGFQIHLGNGGGTAKK